MDIIKEVLIELIIPILASGVFAIATMVLTSLRAKITEDRNKQAIYDALLAGIAKVENDFVRDLKSKSEDGKLTKEEIAELQTTAITYAKKLATGPVKDLLMNTSEEYLKSLVTILVSKFKKG